MSGLESFGGVDESKEFGSGTPRLLLDVDDALLSLNSNCLIRRFSAASGIEVALATGQSFSSLRRQSFRIVN